MGNVIHLLTPPPPATLYHYTTPAGLLGIIEKREIWASHTQYLNDQNEFKHAISIIEDEIAKMKTESDYSQHCKMLDEMASLLKDRETINVCVCSFSEQGDVLSQWRAYGGGAGFSIGFSGAFLRRISDSNDFWLTKCIYDEGEQRTVMRALLKDVLQENEQRAPRRGRSNIPGGNLAAYLNRYAPILKHKSFEEEQEWRIISRPLSCTFDGFAFRAGTSMLIPFFKIPLSTDADPLTIEEVIVGPTPNSRQSRRSLQSLLERHDLSATKVRNTAAPFRNW
jgi:Protein of unknown function (DUF2971)